MLSANRGMRSHKLKKMSAFQVSCSQRSRHIKSSSATRVFDFSYIVNLGNLVTEYRQLIFGKQRQPTLLGSDIRT